MTLLLVLRPEPGASATVERARALGLDAVAVPLFEIEPLDWDPPEPSHYDGLLLTSANATRTAGPALERLRGLPVYAVGEATAEAARDAGFMIAATGEEGVDRLLGSIDAGLHLIHLCGEERRRPSEPRQSIRAVPVYRSTAIEAPDVSCADGTVAMIHSPRAGQRFAELVHARESIRLATISIAAADGAGEGWAEVATADAPNDEALLALAARLCNKPPPE